MPGHGLLINLGAYKFEIRKYAWTEYPPEEEEKLPWATAFCDLCDLCG
jgi:hypothetical protein